MASREEIREGIAKQICYFYLRKTGANFSIITQAECYEVADFILKEEDSQGVVIKVDRELPHKPIYDDRRINDALSVYQRVITKVGYEAVGPLIENNKTVYSVEVEKDLKDNYGL